MAKDVYQAKFEPIVLKQVMADCDISQSELAMVMSAALERNVSQPTINLCINRGYLPPRRRGFKKALETFVVNTPSTRKWLELHGMTVSCIWTPLGKKLRKELPIGQGKRIKDGFFLRPKGEDLKPDLPIWEVKAMKPEVMKYFRIFKDPFFHDVNGANDIFLSCEHRYIETVMLDAAYHAAFVAVIGEVQSGKSIIRKKVMEDLKRDGSITVIYPRSRRVNIGDKFHSRISPVSLCDSIILDISSEVTPRQIEHKVRLVERLLSARVSQGFKHVLIIEEAQNLTMTTLKYLKQFYEMEDGFQNLLGIILIGQPELKDMLDETKHVDLREVIRRIQIAEIGGLGDEVKDYLAFKFKRIGAKLDLIIEDDAIEALSRKLTTEGDGKKMISHAYPGTVNLWISKAMHRAFDLGENRVTAEVIENI
ncbi:MAG: AAA family ATPase [Geobacteraceae bacterium]|nr:AAA family ATPase [Geobacteraceae bacterium]